MKLVELQEFERCVGNLVASKEVSVDVLTPQSSWTVGGAMAAAAAKVHEGGRKVTAHH
jgi:hypothetical protein